jgi:DNA-binding beta-propeller fold protein YncE
VVIHRVIALVVAVAVVAAIALATAATHARARATLFAAKGSGPGYLAAGTPGALPGNILIADSGNNRLLYISPAGQVAWKRRTPSPSSAFATPLAHSVIVTQHRLAVVVQLSPRRLTLEYSYGRYRRRGTGYNRLIAPLAAQVSPSNDTLLVTDQASCRVLVLTPPSRVPTRVFGRTGDCTHNPPVSFAHPDSAFPTDAGGLVVTEPGPGWIDVVSNTGSLSASFAAPKLRLPSDANEYTPGKVIVAGRSDPGAVEELSERGALLWRYAPRRGPAALNRPTLALVLSDGDVLVCDTGNDRVVVIDPTTDRIVWQYGHRGHPGTAPGYLDAPGSAMLVQP